MTQTDKVHAMQIAAKLVGFKFKFKDIDMLTSIYDLVVNTECKATIKDVMLKMREVEERNIDKMPWDE